MSIGFRYFSRAVRSWVARAESRNARQAEDARVSAPALFAGEAVKTLIRRGRLGARGGRGLIYQAWVVPQCGQPTEVETSASNASPQLHVYSARS
jgi:hypothetical protein